MKKILITCILIPAATFFTINLSGQGKRNKLTVETYSVNGNCEMCKNTIENAAKKKGVKKASWDPGTKELSIEYDPNKINPGEILRAVAYAGYDNEKYLAPKSAYEKLHGCCQYERREKTAPTMAKHENHRGAKESNHENHTTGSEPMTDQKPTQTQESGIKDIYDGYFQVKDALVKSNATASSEASKKLLASIDAVNMVAFKGKEHDAYMKFVAQLKANAKTIAENKNIEKQRTGFTALSKTMYDLMQEIKPGYEVYLDHCPMYNDGKGADWLSKEKPIKNPYYGSKMLTCGNVKETIK